MTERMTDEEWAAALEGWEAGHNLAMAAVEAEAVRARSSEQHKEEVIRQLVEALEELAQKGALCVGCDAAAPPLQRRPDGTWPDARFMEEQHGAKCRTPKARAALQAAKESQP